MKFIDKIILCIFSVLILLESVFLCFFVFGWINVTDFYVAINRLLADSGSCNILLGLCAIFILLAIKGIFFESKTEEEKDSNTGILLENDDGKLIVTKEALISIVNSVVSGFESVKSQQCKIVLDENNDLSIMLTMEVSDNAIIKELSNNIQLRIKEEIKKSLDVDVKKLDIKVKNLIEESNEAKDK